MAKLDNMIRFLPDILQPTINVNNRALINAWADGDDDIVAQIEAANDQIFVSSAVDSFLDKLGSNVGVFRDPAFSLSDETYRNLIPLLSYHPKQVKDTIQQVLDAFFGEGNSFTYEVNLNEVVIQIPSEIPGERELRGAFHLTSYSGTIVSIDTILNKIVIDLEDSTQSLQLDELSFGKIGQGLNSGTILGNIEGTTGVELTISSSDDISVFNTSEQFNMVETGYQGSFLSDTSAAFTLRSLRGALNQTIAASTSLSALTMVDSSSIPDTPGEIIIDFGGGVQEGPIDYFSRPNNTSIFIDPSYVFLNNHVAGEAINLISTPYEVPNIDGTDYSAYLSDTTSSVELSQLIIQDITAAGVVVRVLFL